MNYLIVWCYLDNEISDLKPRFEKAFKSEELMRDYENDWEWIYGFSELNNSQINISREHNMKHGLRNKPIRIRIETVNDLTEELYNQTVEILQKEFKTTVYRGKIEGRGIKINEYIVEQEYKNET